ncbi:hypothetical protein EVAR_66114_1 [Eumeta japonica]|uniref:Uncharacterized protein n=1 Tax=Eumeta variegata TaxID=151549 RepID=A0A4C2A8F2_EUMVA|nr:hypothetical protein EVAR_66114_1 [Eumeta japonica]
MAAAVGKKYSAKFAGRRVSIVGVGCSVDFKTDNDNVKFPTESCNPLRWPSMTESPEGARAQLTRDQRDDGGGARLSIAPVNCMWEVEFSYRHKALESITRGLNLDLNRTDRRIFNRSKTKPFVPRPGMLVESWLRMLSPNWRPRRLAILSSQWVNVTGSRAKSPQPQQPTATRTRGEKLKHEFQTHRDDLLCSGGGGGVPVRLSAARGRGGAGTGGGP